jgi:hypothetical protein
MRFSSHLIKDEITPSGYKTLTSTEYNYHHSCVNDYEWSKILSRLDGGGMVMVDDWFGLWRAIGYLL